nr:acyl-[acyl-carrier-protein] thioesterase [Lachnospiraceae bacterium]
MYSYDTRVKYSEIDENGRMKPLALLNLLQDCCTFQSEDVGNGISSLKAMHRAWILNSWQIVIKKHAALGDEILVTTRPYKFSGFWGMRCFEITNSEGEVLAIANSVWVYLNTDTGTPAKIDEEVKNMYGLDALIDYEWAGRKIDLPEKFEEGEPIPVIPSYIDTNHHVNNAWYVELAS